MSLRRSQIDFMIFRNMKKVVFQSGIFIKSTRIIDMYLFHIIMFFSGLPEIVFES